LPLPDERVDAVLLALVLHEADEPKRFLTEIARVIKTGGRLCVIEFTQTGKFGPPRSHRLTSGQINDVAGIAGFRPARKHEWRRRLLGWTYLDLAGFEYVKQSGQE
jgi:ubiquinone/menaquinone biosynthesis C-methylase UbiE